MSKINSKLLEDFMKHNNLSKKQLAEKCGVSVYVIERMLSGEYRGLGDTLLKISLFTEIRVDDLLGICINSTSSHHAKRK